MHPWYDNLLADFGRRRQGPIPARTAGPRQVTGNRAVPDVVSDLIVSPRVTIPRVSCVGGSPDRADQAVRASTPPTAASSCRWTSRLRSSIPAFLRERAISRLGERLTEGVLVVAASEHRSQLRNREAAAARLVSLLRGALAPPPRTRRPTMPSRGAIERRLTDKKANAKRKADRRTPPDW